MRHLVALLAASVVAAGSLGTALGPLSDLDGPQADVLGSVASLLAAESWVARVQALPYSPYAGLDPVPFDETRGIAELVGATYAHFGWELTPEQAGAVDLQAAALPAPVARALQQLLGAIEVGIGDWERATVPWTAEDWEVLRAADPLSREPDARLNPILMRADGDLLLTSTLRLLGVLDEVTPLLRAPVATTDAALFPGPNQGLLFNDPFNLILVGGPETSTYRTHTVPLPGLEYGSNLLTIDVGGNDVYLNRPAAAHPLPGWLCVGDTCNGGLPISVAVDVVGEDTFSPTIETSGSLGAGSYAGIAVLLDLAGSDRYVIDTGAVSQGHGFVRGQGFLMDLQGDDTFSILSGGQGRGAGLGSNGILIDLMGRDTYNSQAFSQGEGLQGGNGWLVDLGGSDALDAYSYSQGWASLGATGILLNVGGSERYSINHHGRGAVDGCYTLPGLCLQSSSVFADVCGVDAYVGWLGSDDAMWQQGSLGRGIDSNHLPLCGSMIG